MKIDSKKFKKSWLDLPEKQKKIRIERSYNTFKKVSRKQLIILKDIKKGRKNDWAFLYFFAMTKGFWRDAEFAFALGKNKWRLYSIYPTRAMMEKTLKLLYFRQKQNSEKRRKIGQGELLKAAWKFYLEGKRRNKPNDIKEWKERYQMINDRDEYPSIENAKAKDFQIFPSIKKLCLTSGLPDANDLYFEYGYLSNLPHGNILGEIMAEMDEGGEYRRAVVLAFRLCSEMLKLTASSLKKTQNEVKTAIKRAEYITKKGLENDNASH